LCFIFHINLLQNLLYFLGVVGGAGSNTSINSVSSKTGRVAGQKVDVEYQKTLNELTQQNMDLKVTVDQVEKEREFYFGKLREIEVYVQSLLDNGSQQNSIEDALKSIQVCTFVFCILFDMIISFLSSNSILLLIYIYLNKHLPHFLSPSLYIHALCISVFGNENTSKKYFYISAHTPKIYSKD
jgi:hypothetical protein